MRYDPIGDALRQARFGNHRTQPHRAQIEPRGVVDEATENDGGLGDVEQPLAVLVTEEGGEFFRRVGRQV